MSGHQLSNSILVLMDLIGAEIGVSLPRAAVAARPA